MKNLTIVLPAYNEYENLKFLLPRIIDVMRSIQIDYEVIVVDTVTSMDETSKLCAYENVKHLHRGPTNSYGCAIRTAIKHAEGEFVVFMDADGSHDPNYLREMYSRKTGADVVVASRYVDGGGTENTPILVLMSKIVNFGYRYVLGLKCKDVSNSLKLYKSELIKDLVLRAENFDIVEEILYKANRKKGTLNIVEIPCTFKRRMYGETKRNLLVFIFTYLVTLYKLRFY